jgi:hypothetical protein
MNIMQRIIFTWARIKKSCTAGQIFVTAGRTVIRPIFALIFETDV